MGRIEPEEKAWIGTVVLLLLTLLVRLPYFFPAVIDWDESTYVLMGQAILDGDRLYLDIWDMKPPGLYFFNAFMIGLFGKSIIAVRLGGAICVYLAALFVRDVSARLFDSRAGLWAGALYIGLASLLPSAQATLTEHAAMVPLTAAIAILVRRPESERALVVVGLLLGAAVMTRTNLAFAAVGLVPFVVALGKERNLTTIVRRLAIVGFAGVSVLGLVIAPYLLDGRVDTWWNAVVAAPLAFTRAHGSVLDTALENASFIVRSSVEPYGHLFGITVLAWVGGFIGWIFTLGRIRDRTPGERKGIIVVLAAAITVMFSIVRSGAVHHHYLIQAAPFAAIGAGWFWSNAVARFRKSVGVIAVMLGVLAFLPVIDEYLFVVDRVRRDEPLVHGPAVEIAEYIEAEHLVDRPILLLTDHIAYWLVGVRPFAPSVTHPSALSKGYLLSMIPEAASTPDLEMARLLSLKPEVVVTSAETTFFRDPDGRRAGDVLDEVLDRQYLLVRHVEDRRIYRLK